MINEIREGATMQIQSSKGTTPNGGSLPNQHVTWAKLGCAIEEFDEWASRVDRRYADECTAMLCYLTDQLQAEGASLKGLQVNHPVLGLLSHMSEANNRMQEFLFAYLAIVVIGDYAPARSLIGGQRLRADLHLEYVAATNCYGGSTR